MIKFSNWNIEAIGQALGRQYDNLTRELRVEGIIPEGWTWDLLVQAGKNLDIIRLNQGGNRLSVMLTSEMLALAGYYFLQLRATQGEKVRHTNVIQVVVPTSLVGDATWPELPSEFSQAEANIRALNAHPPIPGDNGYWLLWDLEAEDYAESQLPLPEVSVGPQGPEGKAASIRVGSVLTGDPGAQAAVSNSGTENDAILDFVLPRGQIGPTGPSGADGRDGKDGVPGAAATIQVGAVTTGEPGTQAQVVNVGTENAAVLQFTIPQGRPGTDGRDGNDGQDGAPGPAGVGVPEIGADDEGRVMTARSGKAVWEPSQGGGGGGVQPDWNQNDPQAADFIKNRPFYGKRSELINESIDADITGAVYLGHIQSSIELTDGSEYEIMFNGSKYTLTAKYSAEIGALYIGNLSLMASSYTNTGEPFLYHSGGTGLYTDKPYSGVNFVLTGEQIHYLPGKYIDPNSVVTRNGGIISPAFVLVTDVVESDGMLSQGGVSISNSSFIFRAVLSEQDDYYALEFSLSSSGLVLAYSSKKGKIEFPVQIDPFGDKFLVDFQNCDVQNISGLLPSFRAADEGKILKIVDGAPTWVTP